MAKRQVPPIGWAIALIATICFSGNLFAADLDPANPEWTFDEKGNAEGWGNTNAITINEVTDGVLKLVTTGNDPYIFCGMGDTPLVWAAQPAYLDVDAKAHPTIYVKMALSKNNNKIEFYYVTKKDTQWSERQVKRWENLAPSGDMEEYEFDMEWSGTITGLRMDFAEGGGIKADIDYLSLVGPVGAPKAVQPEAKLATMWAKMKEGI